MRKTSHKRDEGWKIVAYICFCKFKKHYNSNIKYNRVTNTLKYICIYRKAFVFTPTSNQLNVLVGCNLSFTKSLNTSYFEMDG